MLPVSQCTLTASGKESLLQKVSEVSMDQYHNTFLNQPLFNSMQAWISPQHQVWVEPLPLQEWEDHQAAHQCTNLHHQHTTLHSSQWLPHHRICKSHQMLLHLQLMENHRQVMLNLDSQ